MVKVNNSNKTNDLLFNIKYQIYMTSTLNTKYHNANKRFLEIQVGNYQFMNCNKLF